MSRFRAGPHLLTPLLAAACATGPAVYLQQIETSAEPGKVTGVVRHAATAEPVAGVRVVLKVEDEAQETNTDDDGRFELAAAAGGPGDEHVLLLYSGSEVARAFELEIDEGAELNFWVDPSVPCPTVAYWKRASVPATRPRSERVVGFVGGCAAAP